MLTALTSLAMIALAIHTKRIEADAMEAMHADRAARTGVQPREAS